MRKMIMWIIISPEVSEVAGSKANHYMYSAVPNAMFGIRRSGPC